MEGFKNEGKVLKLEYPSFPRLGTQIKKKKNNPWQIIYLSIDSDLWFISLISERKLPFVWPAER